ncbi:Matrix metallopeptidase 21 [Chamberlinius hualienensis]
MEFSLWWMWTISFGICAVFIREVEGELPFHVRGQSKDISSKNNVINNREKAEELLQKYGYLRCTVGKKHRGKLKKKGVRFCSKVEVREAIRQYQRVFNMPQSGRLDKATMKMMSASRCGNRDDEIGLQSQDSIVVHYKKDKKGERQRYKGVFRQKRSSPIVGSSSSHLGIVESLDENSAIARNRWIMNHMKRIDHDKSDRFRHRQKTKVLKRRKRTITNDATRDIFQNEIITWRLSSDGYSDQMTIKTQKSAIALAFRMWSEVIPRDFYEDQLSPIGDVDIKIDFGRGEHLNCYNNFDGLGGQLSHVIRQSSKAEIHIDDDEYFTLDSERGTNFLKVAVHECGHVLGLHHTVKNDSIMYAIYSDKTPNRNFELGSEDRRLVQSIYGVCEGKFNTIFDWIRKRHDGHLVYNTYFFRGRQYWMYENQFNRTRYGDPLKIADEWKGINGPLDGFAHIWTNEQNEQLFFKGTKYWKYDNDKNRVSIGYPRLISEDFQNIPSNIDTVYFDNKVRHLYFFKENLVYAYDVTKGKQGCCLPGYPKTIQEEFPSAPGNTQLPFNLDAVYYSYTDKTLYLFKDKEYWIDIAYSYHEWKNIHMVTGPYPINQKWRDLCDVLE